MREYRDLVFEVKKAIYHELDLLLIGLIRLVHIHSLTCYMLILDIGHILCLTVYSTILL